MAEDKADTALNQAWLTKVYYSGKGPGESGYTLVDIPELDDTHEPWLFKWYVGNDRVCRQFVDSCIVYREILKELRTIFDLTFVNAKQREAVEETVNSILRRILAEDRAHENDVIVN